MSRVTAVVLKPDTLMDKPKPAAGTTQESRDGFIAILFVVMPLFNVLLMAALSANGVSVLLVSLLAGLISMQVAMLAVWIAMLPGSLWRRVLQAAAAGLVWYVAWAAGLAIAAADDGLWLRDYWFTVGTYLLCCPLISLAAQAPFWLMRICFSWRIVQRHDSREERPLTIRDMLAATGAIAFVLAAARLAAQAMFSTFAELLLMLAGLAAVVIVLSAAITLPLIYGTMKTKDSINGCLVTVSVLVAIAFVIMIVLQAVIRTPIESVAAYITFFSVLIAGQAGVFVTARQMGYVVATPRGMPPDDDEHVLDERH